MSSFIFAVLLQAAVALSGYDAPPADQVPSYKSASLVDLANMVCKDIEPVHQAQCMYYSVRMEGTYDGKTNTVYYIETIDLDTVHGRSVIVHETVHALQRFQKHNGRLWKDLTPQEKAADEKEAIGVQIKYIKLYVNLDQLERNANVSSPVTQKQ